MVKNQFIKVLKDCEVVDASEPNAASLLGSPKASKEGACLK